MQITIIDSLMGTGKTTWAINHMKNTPDNNFIYITPYLSETDRIKASAIPERNFIQPKKLSATSTKLDNFNEHIKYGHDIVSTHELFKRFSATTKYELARSSVPYTLIIDETLDIISPIPISLSDLNLCIKKELIKVDENGICEWIYDKDDYDGRLKDIKALALNGDMLCINNKFFLWRLNPEIFTNNYFAQIYVLTYLFDGSIMKSYFDYYNIKYTKKSIKDGTLVDYYRPDITSISKLINLYQGPLNDSFIQKGTSLSATWYRDENNSANIKLLRNNLYNYFRNILHAPSDACLWSTFLDKDKPSNKTMLGKTRFNKQFLSCNTRGTNIYQDRYALAYMINVYINPSIINFFEQKNIYIDKDKYSLQYMLQWIWRSRIRNNQPIYLYIPSKRMRNLLINWMNNQY